MREGCGERRGSVDRCRRSDGVNRQRGEKVSVSNFRGGGVLAGDSVWGVAMGVGGQGTVGQKVVRAEPTEKLRG